MGKNLLLVSKSLSIQFAACVGTQDGVERGQIENFRISRIYFSIRADLKSVADFTDILCFTFIIKLINLIHSSVL